jgi:murein DD-endopeptidase MepM/ murein hydrolase activator NlpD
MFACKKETLFRLWLCACLLLFGFAACTMAPARPTISPPGKTETPLAPVAPSASAPNLPTRTETLPPTSTPIPSPAPTLIPQTRLCSPLKGISIQELSQLIAGDTYRPPLPGRDDGHHGVDFAFYRHGSLTTMLGLPVQSVLDGKVAAVINDRKPYGNMIIIETPLEWMPSSWLPTINLPTPAPTVEPDPRLTCPKPARPPVWNARQRSVYTLYAHLNQPPAFQVGDPITCGQAIGAVGTTGNSVNPHLHFETRSGPSGASFDSMGHYDIRLNESERANYCLWRVSGWFQLFDPMLLLSEHS